MSKPWESLKFVKEVRIVPDGPSQSPMQIDLIDDGMEYYGMHVDGMVVPYTSGHREYELRYGRGWKTHFDTDYPEDFKRLVQHFGDYEKAYKVYQGLKKPLKVATWMDEAEGKLNP